MRKSWRDLVEKNDLIENQPALTLLENQLFSKSEVCGLIFKLLSLKIPDKNENL